MMNLTHQSTISEALGALARLGAASMKYSINDGKDRPLAFVFVVRGRSESAECAAALDTVEAGWNDDNALGSSALLWKDAAKELPDDNTRVMFACRDTDEPGCGYHEDGRWFYDNDEAVRDPHPVYAWAHVPALPPAKKGGRS
jgi:hypothetical protein